MWLEDDQNFDFEFLDIRYLWNIFHERNSLCINKYYV